MLLEGFDKIIRHSHLKDDRESRNYGADYHSDQNYLRLTIMVIMPSESTIGIKNDNKIPEEKMIAIRKPSKIALQSLKIMAQGGGWYWI